MKSAIKIFLTLAFFISIFNTYAASDVTLTINYSTVGTKSGFDHISKLIVFVDGINKGESNEQKQTIPNSVTIKIPYGSHSIKAVFYAKQGNYWEERTLKNNYSFDCIYNKTLNFNKNTTIDLTFDFNNNEVKVKEPVFNNNTTSNNKVGNYQASLQKINDYLKTFDNGYYGYLELKDGYLYDRFKSGKYCKVLMTDLDKAIEYTTSEKVIVKCKTGKCVYSTYTDAYHEELSFSQSAYFNSKELVTLINNFIADYNNKPSTNNSITNSNNIDYQSALNKINNYLKTFDAGYYGYLEVKDGYLYDRFKSGKYCKALMSDLDKAVENEPGKKVILKCGNDKECVFSTYSDAYHKQMSFSQTNSFNTGELITLLNNFLVTYKNSKSTQQENSVSDIIKNNTNERLDYVPQNNNTQKTDAEIRRDKMLKESLASTSTQTDTDAPKYATSLNALNQYLKIYNSGTYDKVEVKDNKVYFYFRVSSILYNTSIKISDLTQNTTISIAQSFTSDEVKIFCKNDAEYFYSTYSQDYADHFRFFSNSIKDKTKMLQLVKDFVNSLK
ncbi:MAG: hypothetical protein R2760_12035 [Chitinophagales bacterium]